VKGENPGGKKSKLQSRWTQKGKQTNELKKKKLGEGRKSRTWGEGGACGRSYQDCQGKGWKERKKIPERETTEALREKESQTELVLPLKFFGGGK